MDAAALLVWLWKFTHGAGRTWSEIVGCLAAVNLEREGLECTEEEDAAIGYYTRLLIELRNDGKATRQIAADPRFDLWAPAGPRLAK